MQFITIYYIIPTIVNSLRLSLCQPHAVCRRLSEFFTTSDMVLFLFFLIKPGTDYKLL